ncbi:MAG: 50S ribosomal protein L2, partial [Candidatus Omnitrophica bacterium]|nr:50S ribosomal protein L2 [Candidatus Omnitrophota bacterium]
MGIKTFRPITQTQRFKVNADFSEITKETPEKSLTKSLHKTGGRNN